MLTDFKGPGGGGGINTGNAGEFGGKQNHSM